MVRSISFFNLCFFVFSFSLAGCKAAEKETPAPAKFQLLAARVGAQNLDLTNPDNNGDVATEAIFSFDFSSSVDSLSAVESIGIYDSAGSRFPADLAFLNQKRSTVLTPTNRLMAGKRFELQLKKELKSEKGEVFAGATIGLTTSKGKVNLDSMTINGAKIGASRVADVSSLPIIKAYFSQPLNPASVQTNGIFLFSKNASAPFSISLSSDKKVVTLQVTSPLESLRKYTLQFRSTIIGEAGESFAAKTQIFYTRLDGSNKFPLISDEELLTKVQSQTFKYFWDFAHPTSGLIPERNTTPNVVTIGGSGFGVMALIVGVERGFITRSEALVRWSKITGFLKKADRFHGVWPHWMNGATGKTIPFSANDDGGDLVESAFMIQGLITVKQYLLAANPAENAIRVRIDSLVNEVEWDWYRRENQNVLYWHWSPRVGWAMNHQLKGWNETLIAYVLAASSSTHSIPKSVYTNGYATGGEFFNGQSYYGIPLPLGPPMGGPLFFSHYSFLGLKPGILSDPYANYFNQNVSHSRINYAHCVANPGKFVAYSDSCWGLTASDNQSGYNAHSPTNDLGVITPTAALSSFPYTPLESMKALKYFYYRLGDRLWGSHGFYDAFNPTEDWYGTSYLAIDQGPIIIMIENHRSGLLWNLFMSAPEVQQGLTKLGFQY